MSKPRGGYTKRGEEGGFPAHPRPPHTRRKQTLRYAVVVSLASRGVGPPRPAASSDLWSATGGRWRKQQTRTEVGHLQRILPPHS